MIHQYFLIKPDFDLLRLEKSMEKISVIQSNQYLKWNRRKKVIGIDTYVPARLKKN